MFRLFRLTFNSFSIEWDKNYGYNKRTGWSIIENGSTVVELEKFFIICVIKWLLYRKKYKES